MRDLNYDLKRLQAAHDDGSHGMRTVRSYALAQIADTLHDLGFKGLRATGLKRKHVAGAGQGVEAPGSLRRHIEKPHGACALVGETHLASGRGAGSEGQPAQAARRGTPSGGERRADPAGAQLQTAAQGVREPDAGGGPVPHARAEALLCSIPLRGDHGL